MELYLFVVIVLFGLALSDLMVGVSNDAVNFMNSAVGSKAAPRWVIVLIASFGILIGVMFSSGMMEVARKGIFHPEFFTMPELLYIFIAVMITEVILLDLFNTFGLPTSTTVSIVFELLGAAVAISLIKVTLSGEGIEALANYINTAKALMIITGILLSIVVAFTVGMIVQFITRLIFTFDFEKRLKRYGAFWGGVALSAITYFILIKGAKGASFISAEMLTWIKTHTLIILGSSFVVWSVIFLFIIVFTRINILKIIILMGTFALAMAFAANDLVNFIGVPLAGYSTYKHGMAEANPLTASMKALSGPVQTETWMLLIAGTVMVATLWISKKARTVSKTELGLARQDEGDERFEPSGFSRMILRMFISQGQVVVRAIPGSVKSYIDNRFQRVKTNNKKAKDTANWDLLRASVNLMVASMLISLGTSLKLPLSTTYVTFMVAMGTSLSDRAWGRDSAVYRISGVLTVIGGWFLTALVASTVAMLFATLIYFFPWPATILLTLLVAFVLFRTQIYHTKKEKEESEDIELDVLDSSPLQEFNKLTKKLDKYFNKIENNLELVYNGISKQNRNKLKDAKSNSKKICKTSNKLLTRVLNIMQMPDSDVIDVDPIIFSGITESSQKMKELSEICLIYVENQHIGLLDEQKEELATLKKQVSKFFKRSAEYLKDDDLTVDECLESGEKIRMTIQELNRNHLKRVRQGNYRTRQSLLYLDILNHTEAITSQTTQLLAGIANTEIPDPS